MIKANSAPYVRLFCACGWRRVGTGLGAGRPGRRPDRRGRRRPPTNRAIVVTGTLIRGSSEDAPAPIDVISADELAKQGSPSVLDLIKNLPTSNGVIGDANQFDARAQGNEGIASVNLRGLGPQRTLVLLNGKRIVAVGPAASDRRRQPDPRRGDRPDRGAQGRRRGDLRLGRDRRRGQLHHQDRAARLPRLGRLPLHRRLEGRLRRRAELRPASRTASACSSRAATSAAPNCARTDRDFTVRPYPENPQGGYTGGGNPGNFDFNGTAPFIDPVSGRNFGAANFIRDLAARRSAASAACPARPARRRRADRPLLHQLRPFDNLVEPEDRFQFFCRCRVRPRRPRRRCALNGLWGHTETLITTSPSYLPTIAAFGQRRRSAGARAVRRSRPMRPRCATIAASSARRRAARPTPAARRSHRRSPSRCCSARCCSAATRCSRDNDRGSALQPAHLGPGACFGASCALELTRLARSDRRR